VLEGEVPSGHELIVGLFPEIDCKFWKEILGVNSTGLMRLAGEQGGREGRQEILQYLAAVIRLD
jgi:hypothetical protein